MKLSILTQSTESAVLLSLAVILFSGFLVTRLTKMCHLPNVSGFILAGVLIGPGVLNIVPQYIIENMGFMSDIALSFIAFGVGKFFKREIIKSTGKKIVIITLFESIAAGVVVTLAMRFIFSLDRNFALLLGAIATATAPASTMMTINQYHARGEFVNTLLQVVALDDVVCLFVY
ncbi:MAG: cation:proton antiporter, partial [Oscillospiraceae bacterium]